jgi:hypothetical protein
MTMQNTNPNEQALNDIDSIINSIADESDESDKGQPDTKDEQEEELFKVDETQLKKQKKDADRERVRKATIESALRKVTKD